MINEFKEVNILHISDLHFGMEYTQDYTETIKIKRQITLEKLLTYFKDIDPKWKPEIVVITGDIGYKGLRRDYKAASKWIKKLLNKLKLNSHHLIMCAGNHDRNIRGLARRYPKNPDEADKQWKNNSLKNENIRFKEYISFYGNLTEPLALNNEKNFLVGSRKINDLQFLVLNSAQFAFGGKEDKGNLFLGWMDILCLELDSKLITNKKDNDSPIIISVFHHPKIFLNEGDIYAYNKHPASYTYLAEHCHVMLSGHIHSENPEKPSKEGNDASHFLAGATYMRQEYRNNCSILKINLNIKIVEKFNIIYEPTQSIWRGEIDENGPYFLTKPDSPKSLKNIIKSKIEFHSYKEIVELYEMVKTLMINAEIIDRDRYSKFILISFDELRHAFDHVMKAMSFKFGEKENDDAINSNLKLAYSHIYRAGLDNLDILFVLIWGEITSILKNYSVKEIESYFPLYYDTLKPEILEIRNEIINIVKSRTILNNELFRSNIDKIQRLDEIYNYILTNRPPNRKKRIIVRKKKKIFKNLS